MSAADATAESLGVAGLMVSGLVQTSVRAAREIRVDARVQLVGEVRRMRASSGRGSVRGAANARAGAVASGANMRAAANVRASGASNGNRAVASSGCVCGLCGSVVLVGDIGQSGLGLVDDSRHDE